MLYFLYHLIKTFVKLLPIFNTSTHPNVCVCLLLRGAINHCSLTLVGTAWKMPLEAENGKEKKNICGLKNTFPLSY